MSKKILKILLDGVYGGVVEQVHPEGNTVIFQVGNDIVEITIPPDQFSTPPKVNALISVHIAILEVAPKDVAAEKWTDEERKVFEHPRRNAVKLPHEF